MAEGEGARWPKGRGLDGRRGGGAMAEGAGGYDGRRSGGAMAEGEALGLGGEVVCKDACRTLHFGRAGTLAVVLRIALVGHEMA